jgi:hypothetical protein
MVKKRREPLATLEGPYTLSVMTGIIIAPMPDDRNADDKLRDGDIVVDYRANFGLEIILSDRELELKPMPNKTNSQVIVKPSLKPVITFEFFDNPTNVLPTGRFSGPTDLQAELR